MAELLSGVVDIKNHKYIDVSETVVQCRVLFQNSTGYISMTIPNNTNDTVKSEVLNALNAGTYGAIAPYSESTYDLERHRYAKLDEIALEMSREVLYNTDHSPTIETVSWAEQKENMKKYKDAEAAGDPIPTLGFLNSLLAGRNGSTGTESMATLIDKIYNKTLAFEGVGYLIGKRHHLEKKALAATTISEIKAIKWSNPI